MRKKVPNVDLLSEYCRQHKLNVEEEKHEGPSRKDKVHIMYHWQIEEVVISTSD